MKKHFALFLVFGSMLLLVVACRQTPPWGPISMVSWEEDRLAKIAKPAPGKALIYIYRMERGTYSFHTELFINNMYMGKTINRSYYLVELNPGTHIIRSVDSYAPYEIDITVSNGDIYYIHHKAITIGFDYSRDFLEIKSREESNRVINNCRLIKKIIID